MNTAIDSFNYDPLPGKTFGDRYTIERLIGRGGVGLVYLAHDAVHRRPVVVKVLSPHWAQDTDAVARFDREALRMARLDHPNVVKMYDHGQFEGRAYIVMEFIRGEPMRRFLGRRKRLPFDEFVPIAAQILLGAGYVHERGIMMRDIKPANIMLCEHNAKAHHVKLLDFGLAKLIEDDEDDEVTTSHVIGTASYMSPEQIKGEPIDVRVDVYALGILFFRMLTGEQPIAGDNDAAVLINHVHGAPKLLSERLPAGHTVPEPMIELIERCLAKAPADRPDDATAVVESMFEFIPAAQFEQPNATAHSRSAVQRYWSLRMRSGPIAMQAINEDVNDSAEWTRPLLRQPSESNLAPIELAEAEQATHREKIQRAPKPKPSPGPAAGSRRHSLTPGAGLRAERSDRSRPVWPKLSTLGVISPEVRARAPSTVRVTAANAKEAVEGAGYASHASIDGQSTRIDRHAVDDASESRQRLNSIRELAASIEFDEVECIEQDVPWPRSRIQMLPTMPSTPTDAEDSWSGSEASHAYPWSRVRRPDRMIVVVGLVALALGGLMAYFILVTRDPSPPPVVNEDDRVVEAPAAPNVLGAPAAVGRVIVRAVQGAQVEIDGEVQGEAPVSVDLALGDHRVRVTAPGYHPWQTTIDITRQAVATVTAELVAFESGPYQSLRTPTKRSRTRSNRTHDNRVPESKSPSSPGPFMAPSGSHKAGVFLPVGKARPPDGDRALRH